MFPANGWQSRKRVLAEACAKERGRVQKGRGVETCRRSGSLSVNIQIKKAKLNHEFVKLTLGKK